MDWTRLTTNTWCLGGHRILPSHLSNKKSLLRLSQWIRIPRDDLHIRLSPNKVKVALGPDCDLSPHPAREVPLNISTPYIDMLLGPQKPARGQPKQAFEQEELNTLPAPEEVLVTLRLQVDSCGPSDVSALIQILLGGTSIRCRNHHLWIHAVRDYFHSAFPAANSFGLCVWQLHSMDAKFAWSHRREALLMLTLKG